MGTLIMSDASVKTVLLISQNGLTADFVDVAATQANRLTFTGKHTLASSDPYSKSRDLQSVTRKRVDTVTNRQIEVGANLTVWSSNHPNITAADKYDVIHGLFCAIYGTTAAMDAGTKGRIDKLFAGVNLVS